MKRREFIGTAALFGAGLMIGLPQAVFADDKQSARVNVNRNLRPQFRFPRGGCTESGMALFEKGPYGSDPFRFNR